MAAEGDGGWSSPRLAKTESLIPKFPVLTLPSHHPLPPPAHPSPQSANSVDLDPSSYSQYSSRRMDAYWITAYLIVSGLTIITSLLLALLTWEHRRYVRSCMRELARHQPTGRVALFAPCKGLDLDLEANLRAILRQDYDNYEVTFIVENTDDPAYAAIRRAMSEHAWVPARVVVAGRATDSGQKVHNLRVATQHVSQRVKYLAFVDSDARPRPEWLRALVSRLEGPGLGAVTGYRWFTPARPTVGQRLGLQHELRRDLAADPQQPPSDLGRLVGHPPRSVRRRRSAQRLEGNAQRRPGGQPPDARSRGSRCVSSRAAWWPRRLDVSLGHAMSFIRRQYLVARLYTFDWWLFSLVAMTFRNAIWLGNLGVLLCGLRDRLSVAVDSASPSAPRCTS